LSVRIRAALAIALGGLALLATGADGARIAWFAPSILSQVGRFTPAVAVTPRGDTVVAWSNGEASFRPAGGSFGSVEQVAASFSSTPVLGVDAKGDVTALWAGSDGILSAVRDARTGTWTHRQGIAGRFISPSVAVAPSGEAVAVWNSPLAAGTVYWAARAPGGDFGAPQRLGEGDSDVAIDQAGTAVAVWTAGPIDDRTVLAATRPSGGEFGAPVQVSGPGGSIGDVRVVMTPAGETAVAWTRFEPGAGTAVEAAIRPLGGTFGSHVRLSAPGSSADSPDLASDGKGEIFAVWRNSDGGVQSSIARSGAWSAPRTLSRPPGGGAVPRIAANERGDAVAVWDSFPLIYAAIRHFGRRFGPPLVASQAGVDALEPAVAIDGRSNAVAAWIIMRGGAQRWLSRGIVEAAGYDAAGPELQALSIPTRTRVRVVTRFAVAPVDVWSRLASVRWSFGDSAHATGAHAAHAYLRPGSYLVRVTATDAVGHATTARRTVVVT
jgi:PKD domain